MKQQFKQTENAKLRLPVTSSIVEAGAISVVDSDPTSCIVKTDIAPEWVTTASIDDIAERIERLGSMVTAEELKVFMRLQKLAREIRQNEQEHELGVQEDIESEPIHYSPPKHASFIAFLLLPRKTRERVLGDLSEDYANVVTEFGIRRANFWYWWRIGCESVQALGAKAAILVGLQKIAEFIHKIN